MGTGDPLLGEAAVLLPGALVVVISTAAEGDARCAMTEGRVAASGRFRIAAVCGDRFDSGAKLGATVSRSMADRGA